MNHSWNSASRLLLLLVVCYGTVSPGAAREDRKWDSLYNDGLHDPNSPGLRDLQQPGNALSVLTPDATGNGVRWIKALEDGLIKPRTHLWPNTPVNTLDMDIIYGKTENTFYVLFSHRLHTEQLDCSNCHDRIFKQKMGSTPLTMNTMLAGNSCGQCHGTVAFPLSECAKCHSVDPKAFGGKLGVQK